MEQAFWTVVTGTLVFTIGKIIDSFCVKPYIAYKKVIGEITDQLIYYAQVYSSKMMKYELHKNACDKFRKSASRLQAYFNPIEWMHWLKLVPSRNEVDKATSALIGLSNNTPPKDVGGEHNDRRVNMIRTNFRIDSYEK